MNFEEWRRSKKMKVGEEEEFTVIDDDDFNAMSEFEKCVVEG